MNIEPASRGAWRERPRALPRARWFWLWLGGAMLGLLLLGLMPGQWLGPKAQRESRANAEVAERSVEFSGLVATESGTKPIPFVVLSGEMFLTVTGKVKNVSSRTVWMLGSRPIAHALGELEVRASPLGGWKARERTWFRGDFMALRPGEELTVQELGTVPKIEARPGREARVWVEVWTEDPVIEDQPLPPPVRVASPGVRF